MFHARAARSLLSSAIRQNKSHDVSTVSTSRRMFMNATQLPPPGATASSFRPFMVAASGLAIAGGMTVRTTMN